MRQPLDAVLAQLLVGETSFRRELREMSNVRNVCDGPGHSWRSWSRYHMCPIGRAPPTFNGILLGGRHVGNFVMGWWCVCLLVLATKTKMFTRKSERSNLASQVDDRVGRREQLVRGGTSAGRILRLHHLLCPGTQEGVLRVNAWGLLRTEVDFFSTRVDASARASLDRRERAEASHALVTEVNFFVVTAWRMQAQRISYLQEIELGRIRYTTS